MIFGYLLLGGFAALIILVIYITNYRANNREKIDAMERDEKIDKTN